jgi:glycosyltransferase involved in cell wall biosynthesis
MQSGLASVMMPAYNAEQYIAQAIESVLAQSYPHWELVVVDDGSTDNTAAIAARFTDPRIKVIHQANAGEAAARNTALQHMQGEYVAFLDADDVYLPNHLETTVSFLEENKDYDGVYTDGHYCNQEGKQLKTLSKRRRGPFQGWIFPEVVRGSDVFGPPVCVVLRRNLIVQHDLRFDEDITIGPDWVFFVRYSNLGRFGYVGEYTCLYRVHQTNITFRVDRRKRAQELAKCRIRAIEMDSFERCPLDVRTNSFYDLLIELLRGYPERQTEISHWPQFSNLPPEEQARLLRLMVSKTLVIDADDAQYVKQWLDRSRQLNRADRRTALLDATYKLSPLLLRLMLRAKTWRQTDSLAVPPLADLKQA